MNSDFKITSCDLLRASLGKLAEDHNGLKEKLEELKNNVDYFDEDSYEDDEELWHDLFEDHDDLLYLDAPLVSENLTFEIFKEVYSLSNLLEKGATLSIVDKVIFPKISTNFVSLSSDYGTGKFDGIPFNGDLSLFKKGFESIGENIFKELKILCCEYRDDSKDEYCSFGFPRNTFIGIAFGGTKKIDEIKINWGDHDEFNSNYDYSNSLIFKKIDEFDGYEPLNKETLDELFENLLKK